MEKQISNTNTERSISEAAKALRIAKNSLAYKTAIEAINAPGVAIECGKRTGSGRWAGSTSWMAQTSRLLTQAGIAHTAFNVAPLGGRPGDRIKVVEAMPRIIHHEVEAGNYVTVKAITQADAEIAAQEYLNGLPDNDKYVYEAVRALEIDEDTYKVRYSVTNR